MRRRSAGRGASPPGSRATTCRGRPGLAASLRAGLAAVAGDCAAIAPQLLAARAGFAAAEMTLHALAHEIAHGAVIGRTAGARQHDQGRAALVGAWRPRARADGRVAPGVRA